MDAFDHGKYYPIDDNMTPSRREEVSRDMYVVLIMIGIYFATLYFVYSNS